MMVRKHLWVNVSTISKISRCLFHWQALGCPNKPCFLTLHPENWTSISETCLHLLFKSSNKLTHADGAKLGSGMDINEIYHAAVSVCLKSERILYLEKGSVFCHGIFISVIWQDDLEGMCPKSHRKYNADKNVNADTSQLNGKWLDNLISFWSPLLCKLSKSEWYWQVHEA